MKRAARSKPLLQAAYLTPPERAVALPADSKRYIVSVRAVLNEAQAAVLRRRYPELFRVRFLSITQARWAIYSYLRTLEEWAKRDPRNLVNELRNTCAQVRTKTGFTMSDEQAAFIARIVNLPLTGQPGGHLMSKGDMSRAIAACVAFRVRLFVPSKGGKRMVKVEPGVPKVLRGTAAMSDAKLVRSISMQMGSCYFSHKEKQRLAVCEREIRHNGEEAFRFRSRAQRDGFELLARRVYARERELFRDDIVEFLELVGFVQSRLPGLIGECPPHGGSSTIVTPAEPEKQSEFTGQLDLFEFIQPTLFDLEASWYF